MRKTFICSILCICIALTGCVSINPEKDGYSPQSSHPKGKKMYEDTMGLFEAFTKHEELRALFKQAASESLPLVDDTGGHYFFQDGTNAYYMGSSFTDSFRVDEKTADAIRKIEELLPGVHVRMFEIEEGRMCVAFTIMKNTTGEDNGYYEENLIYSTHELSCLDESAKIEEGWWFWSALMP